MSFSRLSYDNNAYELQMNRSIKPGNYMLFAPYGENMNSCFSYTGPVGSKADVSLVQDMADTESKLSWRNQKLSKTNENCFLEKQSVQHKPVCSNKLTPEDTRFTNPLDNFRSLSITELMVSPYLHVNPQCAIQEINDRVGINSRLTSKDLFAMK